MRSSKYAPLVVVGIFAGGCGSDPPPAPQAPPAPTVASVDPTPAPAPETKPEPASKPSMAEMQIKTLKTFNDNFTDRAKFGDAFADDAVVIFSGMPDAKGKDAIVKSHMGFFDGFSDVKTAASRVWQKGDVAITEWVVTATNSKDWVGGKATNKPLGINGATVSWFNADGKIKESHMYVDFGTVMGQLGASKQKVRSLATLPTGTEVHVSKGTPEEDKAMEVVKAAEAAFTTTKKEADLMASMDEAMEFDDFTAPSTFKGKADAKKSFQMWSKAFPDGKGTIANIWAADDYVLVENTMTGTHKGPLGPLKATNKPVNLHSLEVFKVTNGKTTRGWSYSNSSELLTQVGLMPAMGSAKTEAPAKPADNKKSANPAPKGTSPAPSKK